MSEWIARFLGPVFVAAALSMLISPRRIEALNRSFLDNPALVFVSGVLVLVAGLAIVNSHNLWVADWRLIVTLFGWALVLSGAIRVILPEPVKKIGDRMPGGPLLTRMIGAVWAGLGAWLSWKGYG